jgi:hypothetical protein
MTFQDPAFQIPRVTVVGVEPEWVKMFDPRPVGASPELPEPLNPTDPVPEVMEAAGLLNVNTPRTRRLDLLSGLDITTWDNRQTLHFMTFRDKDARGAAGGPVYPGPTIRIPRGVVFHGDSRGKGPPPHTIHWHGIEPTAINDGVGHASMEIGGYTYQWQPNFIGSFFYHCHRNTVQHFEFGLFGNLLIHPPDAFFASVVGSDFAAQTIPDPVVLNDIPIGAGVDGLFRIAANTAAFPQFPGFVAGDPVFGVAGANDVRVGDPHAFTVPYDTEVMWVLDDRDSRWSRLASNAFATFPRHGDLPGENDEFDRNPGKRGFFAFNDFHADYFFNTGVPFLGNVRDADPAPLGPAPAAIPPGLNSGVVGTQIAINARRNRTILVRCLDAAYANTRITFPVDVVIIAWDGRALGVPPFGRYNSPVLVPAGRPIAITTARRFDALIRTPGQTMNDVVRVEFRDTRGNRPLLTGTIPFVVR